MKVVLLGTHSSPARTIPRLIEKFNLSKWIFIGRDAMLINKFKTVMPPQMSRIDIAQDMAKAQREVRNDYLKYAEEVEFDTKRPLWWSGRLAGKNPWISHFFLRFSQLLSAFKVVEDCKLTGHNLLIIVEEPILQRLIRKKINSSLAKVDILSLQEGLMILAAASKLILKGCLRRGWYLIAYLLNSAKYKKLSRKVKANACKSSVNSKQCFCPTYIDSRSFRRGHYSEVFLGKLLETATLKEFEITLIPILISANDSELKQFVDWLNSKRYRLAIPIGVLSYARLVLELMRASVKLPYFHISETKLSNCQVRSLVVWERLEDWAEISLLQPFLLDKLSSHLAASGEKQFLLVYPFENQVWEKSLLYFLRRYACVYAVGIQNAPCPSLSTRFFLTEAAINHCPLPDVILANGDISYQALRENLSPKVRIEKCCSSRPVVANIGRCQRINSFSRSSESSPKEILVASSIGLLETRELIFRITEALGNSIQYRVGIALHPLVSLAALKRYGTFELPKNFYFSSQLIEELLKQADVVLCDSSTMGLQTLTVGAPVIYVGHECFIHVEPTEYDRQHTLRAYSIADIREMIEQVTSLGERNEAIIKRRRQTASKYFGDESVSSAVYAIATLVESFYKWSPSASPAPLAESI